MFFLLGYLKGSCIVCFSLKGDCSEVYLLDTGVPGVMKSLCHLFILRSKSVQVRGLHVFIVLSRV